MLIHERALSLPQTNVSRLPSTTKKRYYELDITVNELFYSAIFDGLVKKIFP